MDPESAFLFSEVFPLGVMGWLLSFVLPVFSKENPAMPLRNWFMKDLGYIARPPVVKV